MRAMHLLRAEQQLGERQLEQRLHGTDAPASATRRRRRDAGRRDGRAQWTPFALRAFTPQGRERLGSGLAGLMQYSGEAFAEWMNDATSSAPLEWPA